MVMVPIVIVIIGVWLITKHKGVLSITKRCNFCGRSIALNCQCIKIGQFIHWCLFMLYLVHQFLLC